MFVDSVEYDDKDCVMIDVEARKKTSIHSIQEEVVRYMREDSADVGAQFEWENEEWWVSGH